MLIKIHPENPDPRKIKKVAGILDDGGVIIYPTDTVYGMGCDIFNSKAVERIARIKGIRMKDHDFSLICHDFTHLSNYTKHFSNSIFKMLKKNLPGPFTFILPASGSVPRLLQRKKKTVGIRIPDNPIILKIVTELNRPILTTSIYDDDELVEYTTDPELIHEKFEKLVDAVIDGGFGGNVPSTVIDCTNEEPAIIREGKGVPEL